MTAEWIVFFLTAVLLFTALICFTTAVIGVYRFGYILNRMHAAGIGDSLGLFLVIAAVVIATGLKTDSLKMMLLILFMWFSSPASSHFLSQVEYYTNKQYLLRTLGSPEGSRSSEGGEVMSTSDKAGTEGKTTWK